MLEKGSGRYFGSANRLALLQDYLDANGIAPGATWKDVYRLLLWIDPTIGLAHCYESDKAQPGRPWYERSVRFHRWLSESFGVHPKELGDEIDLLFRRVVAQLRAKDSTMSRLVVTPPDLPEPGSNPEAESIVEGILRTHIAEVPEDLVRDLVSAVSTSLSSENKRKNLLGEGFEDSLAALLQIHPHINGRYDVMLRPPLHEIEGFNRARQGTKTKHVDLALVRKADRRRILISCKWSVRSDREEQFATDFEAYSALENRGETFDYVLITNEFDPARLSAASENRRGNALIFDHVVHVNTDGLRAAYGPREPASVGMRRVTEHLMNQRLVSLDRWIERM